MPPFGISKLALNNALEKHKIKANDKLFQLSQSGEIHSMTAKQFCLELHNSSPITPKVSYTRYFDDYIQRLDDIGKIGNCETYKYTQRILSQYHKEEFSFEQFNYLFIKKFDEYLIKRGNGVNTLFFSHKS